MEYSRLTKGCLSQSSGETNYIQKYHNGGKIGGDHYAHNSCMNLMLKNIENLTIWNILGFKNMQLNLKVM